VLEISGQFMPSVGEHAVIFLQSPDAHQINPLPGWYQGYLPIQEAGGVAYLDLRDRPELILANLAEDPLLNKMLSLRVDEAQLEARFPNYARFELEDFLLAIEAEVAASAVAP